MSDTSQDNWATDVAPPPAKQGLPSWLLFCGGGCLIAVLLGVVGIFLIYDNLKDTLNPEAQWTTLEAALELDARPNEMAVIGGIGMFGTQGWMMAHDSGYVVMIIKNADGSEEELNELFGGNVKSSGIPGLTEIEDHEQGEITVQGRVLRSSRFKSKTPGQAQQARFVEITPEGESGFVLLYVVSNGQTNGDLPIGDAAVNDLLRAFVIGPDRTVYVPDGPHPQAGQTSLEEGDFKSKFKASATTVETIEEVEAPGDTEESPQDDE